MGRSKDAQVVSFRTLSGVIASAGFASGDRFVVGHWTESPLGPITDLMWATPAGERRLLASTEEISGFVSAVYGFDRTDVAPLECHVDDHHLDLSASALALELHLTAGPGWRIPFRRPAWFTRWVEAPVARRLLGVRTYGVSPSGVREWYRADVYRPVVDGHAAVSGRDLGELRPLDPPVRFGFSEPPRRPSMVWVRPLLHDPSGALDRLLSPGRRPAPLSRRGRG
jgi:hypothetical protein